MKTKFGSIIVDARGKIGGHVASKNRSGSYLRTKVTPVNRDSVDQRTVRSNQTTNSKAWSGLSAAQRLAWNNSVSDFLKTNIFGDQKILSGFQLFCMINNNLLFIGEAVVSTPPAPASVSSLTSMSATCDDSDQKLTVTFAPACPATEKVIVSCTAPMSAGKNFAKAEYRKIAVIGVANASPLEIQSGYITKFGALPAVGKKVFIKFKHVSIAKGIAGAEYTCSCICVS